MHLKKPLAFLSAQLCSLALTVSASAAPIVLSSINTPYSENFNTLANTGTSSALPEGWAIVDGTLADNTYAADNGSLATANTYSYGNDGRTERGLGSLADADSTSLFGVQFQNMTGSAIKSLEISYRGEVWRLGTLDFVDRLDFQYSTNATSLITGTWIDFDPLDFSAAFLADLAVSVGRHSGNSSPYNTLVEDSIIQLDIANESTFWLRWNDVAFPDALDDGLSIDQFRINPVPAAAPPLPEPSGIVLLAGMGLWGAVRLCSR